MIILSSFPPTRVHLFCNLGVASIFCFINRGIHLDIMSKDEIEGRGKKIKGQIREEVGKLTDNKTEQVKGKIEQVQGKVQEEVGKIKRKAK